jgi:hypothetical protein
MTTEAAAAASALFAAHVIAFQLALAVPVLGRVGLVAPGLVAGVQRGWAGCPSRSRPPAW